MIYKKQLNTTVFQITDVLQKTHFPEPIEAFMEHSSTIISYSTSQ
jgi:hypothetical protein